MPVDGFDLFPVLVAIAEWGDRYLVDADGPPVEFTHRDCDAVVHAHLTCAQGHDVAARRDIVARPGPGAVALDVIDAG